MNNPAVPEQSSAPSTPMQGINPTPPGNTAPTNSSKKYLPMIVILGVILLVLVAVLLFVLFANPSEKESSASPTPVVTSTPNTTQEDTLDQPTISISEEPSDIIMVNGEEWTSFEYVLPDDISTISGYAPASHAFGTDYATNSALGNSFSFGMVEGEISLRLQFTITEASWIYYEEEPLAILQSDSGKAIYKFSAENPVSVFYTDSYQTTGCEQYQFFADIETSSTNNPCGTGTMYSHGFIVTCDYQQADRLESTWMCDEVVKRITLI